MFQRLVCSLACIVCNFVFLCFCFHFVSFQSTVHTELFHLFADFESARGVLADDFYFHCSTYFFPCICQHSSFICFLFQRVSCFLFIFIPPFILPTSISGLHASFFFFFFCVCLDRFRAVERSHKRVWRGKEASPRIQRTMICTHSTHSIHDKYWEHIVKIRKPIVKAWGSQTAFFNKMVWHPVYEANITNSNPN